MMKSKFQNGEMLKVKTQIKSEGDSTNLVLLDHQLLKNNRTLSIDKMNSKEDFLSIIFNGKTSTHFRAKSLLVPT